MHVGRLTSLATAVLVAGTVCLMSAQEPKGPARPAISTAPLAFGAFTATFGADGTFRLTADGWPPFVGTWTGTAHYLEFVTPGPEGCASPGRYQFRRNGETLALSLDADPCVPRRMILDRSTWRPAGTTVPVPPRAIVTTVHARTPLRPASPATASWPSFRGPQASGVADGQHLPDQWNATTGEHVLWRTPIPGLAHASPVVWGDRVFIATAVSSDPNATFRRGLYGDGDASEDRSRHKWMTIALDRKTGRTLWERVAYEGEPRNKRHIKSTYASASPATDGRIVVAWFGSQGVHAWDVDGTPRWSVDLGRLDMGAYDIPSYEWGPASSPIIWEDLVILQVDTQADSFLLALRADTGATVWKTDRDELPSWGTPTVARTPNGPVLVTNASKHIRGYDPRTGKELWRLGGSSKITAPTPIASGDLLIVASGRAPERPIFAVRSGARGDLTLRDGATSSEAVAWSRTGRGSYMPTPIVYHGILYVLANNGVLDAYRVDTGEEIYRQRLPVVGSGYSASMVAADGRLYLSSEDGDILVVAAGREFRLLGTNPIGEPLMATPALADGVMYVRSSGSLFAIGRARP